MNKVLPLFAAIAMVIFFSSCEKSKIKNCVEDMTGTYMGTSTCFGYATQESATIAAGTEDEDIIFTIVGDAIVGQVDDECNVIFESQDITDSYGDTYTYAGTGSFDENEFQVTVTITSDLISGDCSFVGTK